MSMPTINHISPDLTFTSLIQKQSDQSVLLSQPFNDSIHFSGKKSEKKKKTGKKASKKKTGKSKSETKTAQPNTSAAELFKKYGLSPKNVRVEIPQGVNLPDGVTTEELLFRLLEGHEHALKNAGKGNFSGRYYASNMLMSNGEWYRGANTELTKKDTMCAERSVFLVGRNIALDKTPLEAISTEPLKVKLLTINDAYSVYSDQNACFECQNWMKEDRIFGPDVLIAHLTQDEDKQPLITLKPLKEMMPLNGLQSPSITDKPVEELPIHVSDKAKAIIQASQIKTKDLVNLMATTKQENQNNNYPKHSGNHDSVGIMWSNRYITKGSRMDITATRSSITPLENATGRGVDIFSGQPKPPKIGAVAFYGPTISPSPVEVGFIAQAIWGNIDSLVVTVENDILHVRTLRDFSEDIYVSPLKYVKETYFNR